MVVCSLDTHSSQMFTTMHIKTFLSIGSVYKTGLELLKSGIHVELDTILLKVHFCNSRDYSLNVEANTTFNLLSFTTHMGQVEIIPHEQFQFHLRNVNNSDSNN